MKLGLLGAHIQHSLSPSLYHQFLGDKLTSYELFDIGSANDIPSLSEFAKKLDGLSITTPYKTHFLSEVSFKDPEIQNLGGINCISFADKIWATNTDYLALKELLPETINSNSAHEVLLLGNGVMANITRAVLLQQKIPFRHLTRKDHGPLEEINLSTQSKSPLLIINACSRDFIFRGKARQDSIFWDYNYSFRSHSETLPSLFQTYIDGQELLRRQALSAISFWRETNSKLKC